ncbi:hypothetical protein D3C80_1578730 [compost metagenome]
MRLVLPQRLDVGDAQLVAGNAELAQRHVLGDGIVLAVAGAFPQRLQRRRPVVVAAPQAFVVAEQQGAVEVGVHRLQLAGFVEVAAGVDQVSPVLDALACLAEVAVGAFGALEDFVEFPVRQGRAECRYQQRQQKVRPAARDGSVRSL